MSEAKNIHEAINAVMKEVGYVQKTKTAGLNYSYAGEAALIQALRPSMVEHGIYVSVSKIHNVQREQYTTAKGTAMVNTVINGVVRFTHVSGDFVDVESGGEGSDAGDKSLNKAMTGMYKYALRQTFNIETGDDPDKFASDEQERPPQVLSQKPLPEKKVVVPANDLQKVKADFSTRFREAKALGITLESLKGNATEAEIKAAIAKADKLIAAARPVEEGA